MIGVFDSGVGGLTVVREIKRAMPDCRIVYFGDTARYPWGNKNAQTVCKYSEEICEFLIAQGVKDIVIACNTASTFAGDYLRKKFSEINFFDVIDPVVRRIERENFQKNNKTKVGVIGTRGTIESRIYEKKIHGKISNTEIISQACPLFVSLAEEGMANHKIAEIIAKEYLAKMKNKKINFLVLGCTHYPLLEKTIKKVLGKVLIISSAKEVAKELASRKNILASKKENDIFYFSDISGHYDDLAQKILGKKVNVKKAIL